MTQDDKQPKAIILAAGGTGGHVFPAIATAQELLKRGYAICFFTDVRGEKYIKPTGYQYKIICSASPTGSIVNKIKAGYQLLKGMLQSAFLIGVIRPKAIIGFGGYPSFPPLISGRINFIKTVLHEQNSILGKANRFLNKFSTALATSFPQTGRGRLVGNPVRAEIEPRPYPAFDGKLNILITGGSQGAKLFAEVLPKALTKFADKITIVHQVRETEIEQVSEIYKQANADFTVQSFFNDMPKRLARTHLVIARSGASTVFELAMVGRPAILIPLKNSAENHQYHNAKAVSDIGGGWLLEEKDFSVESISAMISRLLENKAELETAAENIRQFASLDAAKKLVDLVEEIIK